MNAELFASLSSTLFWFTFGGILLGIGIAICYIRFLMPKQSKSHAVGIGLLAIFLFAGCGAGVGLSMGVKALFSRTADAVIGEVKPHIDSTINELGLNPQALPTGQARQILANINKEIETLGLSAGSQSFNFSWGFSALTSITPDDLPSLKKDTATSADLFQDLKNLAEKKIFFFLPGIVMVLCLIPLIFAFIVHFMVKSEKKEREQKIQAEEKGQISF